MGDFTFLDSFMNKTWGGLEPCRGIYQSHNNKNDHLIRPREGPGLSAWVSSYHHPSSFNKQLLLWKISSVDN